MRRPSKTVRGPRTVARRSNTDTGRQGEFFAAYILETHGVEVHHVDREGADLWCKINTTLLTLQVKTALTPVSSNTHTQNTYYTFAAKTRKADYFCFVALDKQIILLKPIAQINASTIRIAPTEFNEVNQRRTIEAMRDGT